MALYGFGSKSKALSLGPQLLLYFSFYRRVFLRYLFLTHCWESIVSNNNPLLGEIHFASLHVDVSRSQTLQQGFHKATVAVVKVHLKQRAKRRRKRESIRATLYHLALALFNSFWKIQTQSSNGAKIVFRFGDIQRIPFICSVRSSNWTAPCHRTLSSSASTGGNPHGHDLVSVHSVLFTSLCGIPLLVTQISCQTHALKNPSAAACWGSDENGRQPHVQEPPTCFTCHKI